MMTDAKELQRRLLRTIWTLMLCDNLGDVHGVINALHTYAGLDVPQGDFLDGWELSDWHQLRQAMGIAGETEERFLEEYDDG